MRAEGGVIITQGCYIFPDSTQPQSQCDISSAMNMYSAYSSSNQLAYIKPNISFTGLDVTTTVPDVANEPVFCGPHQFTFEVYFTNDSLLGGNYSLILSFYNTANQLIASVFKSSGFALSGSYTVSYNNGIVSSPAGAAVNETATSSEFKLRFAFGTGMRGRARFH